MFVAVKIIITNYKQSSTAQQELLQQLRLLPVRSEDSVGVKRRKLELERRISEVDEAILVFSKSRVFVRIDQ